jgi:hypothetical protein
MRRFRVLPTRWQRQFRIGFPLEPTFLLSSRTSRRERQEIRIALVAQGIERLPPEQKAVGSNPTEGTSRKRPGH